MLEASPAEPFRPRKSTRRDPWTEAEAREVLRAASQSGLSTAAFARRHGIPAPQLYWWHMRIRTHACVEPGRPQSFLPVAVGPSDGSSDSGVEVVVADAVIRVASGFCEQTLARTVAVLRRLPC
jgi:transposase-like protein